MSSVKEWESKSLTKCAKLTMGQSPDSRYYTDEETCWPFLQGCAEFTARFPSPAIYCTKEQKIGRCGSILFSVRAPVGKINIADQDYVIGRGLAAIEGDDVTQGYLEQYLIFETSSFRNASQGSTFEAINGSELSNWPIFHPKSKPEQAKIAEVLSTVDRAIEQTEALIAKQQRIKTGLMQDLLTRGIDQHGNLRSEQTHKFKDSPLGRIPVEWEAEALDTVSDFVTSGSRGWAQYYSVEGPTFIRIGNLTRHHINMRFEDVIHVTPPKSSEGQRTFVQTGDLLISITADLGITGVIPDDFKEAYVNQHIALVRLTHSEVAPRFIGWFLSSRQGQTQFEKLNESGAKAGLNLPTIRNLLIPKMDLSEQNRIADILDSHIAKSEQLHERQAKLRSLKTALMQDLLTGQVRVTDLLDREEVNDVCV